MFDSGKKWKLFTPTHTITILPAARCQKLKRSSYFYKLRPSLSLLPYSYLFCFVFKTLLADFLILILVSHYTLKLKHCI